jgi:IclR family transcriptional regulator, KDG regulon repressor
MDGNNEAFYNRSLERALQILNAFSMERQALTLAQLSGILSLPRATVLRLCTTLVKYGFLRQEPESKQYSLGVRLFELGSIVFYSLSLAKIAAPYLGQLQTKLGKTAFLGILEKGELLYIDKREDPGNPISFTSKVGTRRPPYWGMLGPVLMAYLPDAEVETLLEKSPLTATSRKSITKKDEFKAWLSTIREQGFAVDIETALEGISGVGAPVYDLSGKVVAAIGVAFISSSVDAKGVKRVVKEAVGTARSISRELGYLGEKGAPEGRGVSPDVFS